MSTTFYVGDIWKPKDTIKEWDSPEANVDPTTVTAKVTAPNGTVTEPAVTKLEVGVYRISVSLTEPGLWHVAYVSTGSFQGAKPETITVYPV